MRKRRKELKLTQTDLAVKLGLKRDAIGDYEKDRTQPRSFEARKALAEALELAYSYLFQDDKELGLERVKPISTEALRRVLVSAYRDRRVEDLKMWGIVLERMCLGHAPISEPERRVLEDCRQQAETMLERLQAEAPERPPGQKFDAICQKVQWGGATYKE